MIAMTTKKMAEPMGKEDTAFLGNPSVSSLRMRSRCSKVANRQCKRQDAKSDQERAQAPDAVRVTAFTCSFQLVQSGHSGGD